MINETKEVNISIRENMDMLEEITIRDILNEAYNKVHQNRGAGSVDRMEANELLPYLKAYDDEIMSSMLDVSYRLNPVRRVKIPKENGKTGGLEMR